ncbi:hypothetical protein [Candidatus Magnetobacterium casense]|uniref:Uncharacterized protein n=1 Tax=Candidatus Magnetobacterium casense TaxID=1455061 RepID=A0ABS6S212_9BACT|nr:hypothetical protein [Candidatus Magnetobacterium casensis]MBV6342851.1 hypothetical protein [Candidatus Magnetobacterium casensis]
MPGTQPIRATPGSGWMKDSSGMMAPLGSATSVKELQQLPKDMRDITLAANTIIRGNFTRELWSDLAMLNALAPRHRLTQVFIASVTAGSMAEGGAASKKFLMGITNMLAPGMLEDNSRRPYDKRKTRRFSKDHKGEVTEDEE